MFEKSVSAFALIVIVLHSCAHLPSEVAPTTNPGHMPSASGTSPKATATFQGGNVQAVSTLPSLPTNSRPPFATDQARQMVMSLFEKNPCGLPCWWGITPGETTWGQAWQLLMRLAVPPTSATLPQESQDLPGYGYRRVYLDVPVAPDQDYYFNLNNLWFVINIQTSVITYIRVNTGNVEAYTIPKILAEYGQPQEIFVLGTPGPVSYFNGISLYLFYPQYGFLSTHFTTVSEDDWNKPTLTACFQKYSELALWPKRTQLGLQDLSRLGISDVSSYTVNQFKRLDRVSALNVRSFYLKYVDKQQPCIDFQTSSLINAP
jgi:hypothetical protein